MKLLLWFAPGALFYEADSPHQGTPKSLECVLFSTPRPLEIGEGPPVLASKLQAARFELESLEPSKDIANYSLANGPPDGYRWILIRPGRICVERIPGA